MNKDVIYIDVEDDITSIIGKVKASKEKVVALVPPKRVGVLQSAVNLKLLQRAAKLDSKRLALVTNNHALVALAAAAQIPTAKNLQTAPELHDVPAAEGSGDDDVIDGAELPVGDHAAQTQTPEEKRDKKSAEMAAALSGAALANAPEPGAAAAKPKVKKSSPKVPNFNTFRKKLILGGVALLALIAFLVWAFVIAPHATIVISAKTSSNSVNQPVSLVDNAPTSLEKGVLQATAQTQNDTKTVEVAATGKKDAGSKATGTVRFSTSFIGNLGTTIPAGTKLTASSGVVFTTDSSVTFTMSNYSGATTSVTAVENGSKYNAASGQVSGAPSGVSASLTDATSGGVTKMVTIVTAEDVQKAKESLVQGSTDDVKNALKTRFDSGYVVAPESFRVDYADTKVAPDVGQEAPGDKATLSSKVVYTLYGVKKAELSKYLDAYLAKDLAKTTDQRVYKNGQDTASFQEVSKIDHGAKATLIATAQVGPKINNQKIIEQAKGKRYGEVQQALQSVQGVQSVDVRFYPPWIGTVPDDDKRITVDFKINESK